MGNAIDGNDDFTEHVQDVLGAGTILERPVVVAKDRPAMAYEVVFVREEDQLAELIPIECSHYWARRQVHHAGERLLEVEREYYWHPAPSGVPNDSTPNH